MNRLLVAFLLLFVSVSGAIAKDAQCLAAIGNDDAGFVSLMYQYLGGKPPFPQENTDEHKNELFGLVAANIELKCLNGPNRNDFQTIADSKEFQIPFTYKDNKKYILQVDTAKLFSEYIDIPTGILVVDNRNYKPGDVIKKSDMPTYYFFDSACSDHYVRLNLSDDAGVNVAGQKVFAEYGGSKNEFFLDFPVGESCRSFPGLVIADIGTLGAKEQLVAYRDYLSAQRAVETFATALKSTACSNNSNRLAVYLVSLDTKKIVDKNGTSGWVIGAGVGGAAAGALAVALGSNPVGWIIGAVGAVVGGIATGVSALFYKELTPIEQVVVLKGPYNI